MYQKRLAGQGSDEFIVRVSDQAYIPLDPANTDYQAFLAWVAEGGTPEVIE